MAVRARSRASRSSRKASQFCLIAAQFVEFGVEARRDHAAVAQQHRGFFGDGAGEQGGDRGGRAERVVQLVQQRRATRARGAQRGQALQRVAQAGEFARPHLAQRDARR